MNITNPFHGCIGATVSYLRKNKINDQVNFFFDEQGKVGKWARDMYEEMKISETMEIEEDIDPRPYLGVCVSHDDKKVVALQAADLFASRARRYDERVEPIDDDPAFSILAMALPCEVSYWRPERIQIMIDKWFPPTDDTMESPF